MKYIKRYEKESKDNQDIAEFQSALCELAKEFFENVPYTTRIVNNTVEFRSKGESHSYPETFFFVEVLNGNNSYSFNIGKNYIDIDDWIKTIEFEKYLVSLLKPLSYNYNKNYDHYYLMDSKFKALIKEMDIEKYQLNTAAKKYNL